MHGVLYAIGAVIALGLFYVVVPVVTATYARFRGSRSVTCPRDGEPTEIEIDAFGAAVSAAVGDPVLRVSHCTHWPERSGCEQECLQSAS